MNVNDLTKSAMAMANKVGFALKKRSPEILIVTGVVGGVTAAVMACKATTKANDILDEYRDDISNIEKCENDHSLSENGTYTDDDARKDRVIVYIHTAGKFIKLYGPSVVVGITSIVCIFASNNILRKRGAALAAAYSALDCSFSEYRNRVVDKYGEDADKEFMYSTKAKKITEKVTDANGDIQKVSHVEHTMHDGPLSMYARVFAPSTEDAKGNAIRNVYFDDDYNYNEAYIRSREQYATDKLTVNGHLFLNDVYKMLGFPPTKAGQIVGWSTANGDTYVSFASYNKHGLNDPLIHDEDGYPVLDFNVSGNIIEQLG